LYHFSHQGKERNTLQEGGLKLSLTFYDSDLKLHLGPSEMLEDVWRLQYAKGLASTLSVPVNN
jgi:hypothetical protein